MYAGVSSRINSSNAERDDVPEWKRVLIMKKRGSHPAGEEGKLEPQTRSNSRGPLSSAESGGRRAVGSGPGDSLPAGQANKFSMLPENDKSAAETVIRTIGNIKVELRSVYKAPAENGADEESCLDRYLTSPSSEPVYPDSEEEEEDLPYGPGIVDRLKAKFSNLGLKQRRNPAVRKFSSLENLSGGNSGMFRASGSQCRNERRLGARSLACGSPSQRVFPSSSSFKKAQSMETLLVESNPFPSRRANARIFARGSRDKVLSPISRFADALPRLDGKRVEYSRQGSAPSINEDELPKPDTVKHFKRIFESPQTDKTCHVPANPAIYEKGAHNRAALPIPGSSCATKTTGSAISAKDCDNHAKSSAKLQDDSPAFKFHNGSATSDECHDLEANQVLSPASKVELEIASEPSQFTPSPSATPTIAEEPANLWETDVNKDAESLSQAAEASPVAKVTPERLPLVIESPSSNSDSESPQGSQVGSEPEQVEEGPCVTAPGEPEEEEEEESASSPAEMVIASEALKKPSWQKPPPPNTSIVFDFRGKDVKPHISLNPAPFGCRPAKVKKRAGSPPRGDGAALNGDCSSEEEEDWDEMDIGADLPAVSGIVFSGENVKVGRGSLLEKRNKKLTLQFDDQATSTYEYPCESPSPLEENGHAFGETNLRPLPKPAAMNNTAFANSALSSYTPHALSGEFELGVCPPPLPVHRRLPAPPEPEEPEVAVLPADPEDTSGWSSAETADILF